MVSFSSPVFWQVKYLVQNLTKKTYKSAVGEIHQLIDQYGPEVQVYLITCLLRDLDLKDRNIRGSQKLALLAQEISVLASKANFATLLCQAFQALDSDADGGPSAPSEGGAAAGEGVPIKITAEYLNLFYRLVGVTLPTMVTVAVAMASSPSPHVANEAVNFLAANVHTLAPEPASALPLPVLRQLVFFIRSHPTFTSDPECAGSALRALQASQGEAMAHLGPLVAPHDDTVDVSEADTADAESSRVAAEVLGDLQLYELLLDFGYSATASEASFRTVLAALGRRPGKASGEPQVTANDVARLLAHMANSLTPADQSHLPALAEGFHSLLGGDGSRADEAGTNTWNLDVVVHVLTVDYPHLDWEQVVRGWDLPKWQVSSGNGWEFLVNAVRMGSSAPFPTHVLLEPWQNPRAQLSVLQFAVQSPPDRVTFARCKSMAPVEGSRNGVGTPNQAWCALGLYSALLRIARIGGLHRQVHSMFKQPAIRCPDLLLLGLGHVVGTDLGNEDSLRDELFSSMVHGIFANPPPPMTPLAGAPPPQPVRVSPIQLTLATRLLGIAPAVYQVAMSRLWDALGQKPEAAYRVYEISRNIKNALRVAMVTNRNEFVLELSYITARQQGTGDFSLDTWLDDRLRRLGEPFAAATLRFLKAKVPGPPAPPSDFPPELLSIYFKRLLPYSSQYSKELQDAIKQHHNVCCAQFPQMVSNHDIEEWANAYFQKIYTAQQSIDDVIAMLKRFKDSNSRREQEIFACMIHNLFEEYRFFHKYPEKELRITGVLFGNLIQHQLLSQSTLGIAMRYVLESLSKPPGKMFRFGLCALEQFKSRLPKWPGYCNHVLQIPHLRAQQPALVAELERALKAAGVPVTSGGAAAFPGGRPDPTDPTSAASSRGPSPSPSSGPSPTLEGADGGDSMGMPTSFGSSMFPGFGSVTAPGPVGRTPSPHVSSMLGGSSMGMGGGSGGAPGGMSTPSAVAPGGGPAPGLGLGAGSQSGMGAFSMAPGPIGPSHGAAGPSGMSRFGASMADDANDDADGRRGAAAAAAVAAAVDDDDDADHSSPGPEENFAPPSDRVVERIMFAINNVTATNVERKATEIMELVEEPFYDWFASVVMCKRVSTQPNLHDVYRSLLVRMKSVKMERCCMLHGFAYVRQLLASADIRTSSQSRTLLKNMGSWIGKMTLARNKPLLHKWLDLKSLLLEAYEGGKLIACVPFVSKILESGKDSLVFRPPNPWVMGLMGTLREIYDLPELKLNIKFEVELLCNALSVELKEVRTRGTLAGRGTPRVRGNPDFNMKPGAGGLSATPSGTPTPGGPAAAGTATGSSVAAGSVSRDAAASAAQAGDSGVPLTAPSVQNDGHAAAPAGGAAPAPAPTGPSVLQPSFLQYVKVNQSLDLFRQQPGLARLVPLALDHAIREIIQPVVDRSVSMACITTRDLVLKDFAMEVDVDRLLTAAHGMVSDMAASLAQVTCKDPLRTSFQNHLRSLLMETAPSTSTGVVTNVVNVCAADNLDFGCRFIERAATEKAIHDIDEQLAAAIAQRRKHREDGVANPFFDATALQAGVVWFNMLPPALRPGVGGLTAEQLKVYDAFRNKPRAPAATDAEASNDAAPPAVPASSGIKSSAGADNQASNMIPTSGNGSMPVNNNVGSGGQALNNAAPVAAPPAVRATLEPNQAMDRFRYTLEQVDIEVNSRVAVDPTASLANAGPDDRLVRALEEVRRIPPAIVPAAREQVVMHVASLVFKRLVTQGGETLSSQTLIAVLAGLNEFCKDMRMELTRGLERENKFNVELHVGLLRAGLVVLQDYDRYLATSLEAALRFPSAMESMVQILQRVLVKERIATPNDFPSCMDQLVRLSKIPGKMPSVLALVEGIRNMAAQAAAAAAAAAAPGGGMSVRTADVSRVRERVMYWLESWVRICDESGNSANPERTAEQYLSLLQQQAQVLTSEAALDEFFRFMTELCVENTLASATPADHADGKADESGMQFRSATVLTYKAIDAMSALVMHLVRFADPAQGHASKPAVLKKVLSVVTSVLASDAANKGEGVARFDARPYFRLLSNMLHDLNALEPLLDTLSFGMLVVFAEALHAVNPRALPRFAFAWLELVSHRMFMPKLLNKQAKGWGLFHVLLLDLFHFMAPWLNTMDLTDSVRLMYNGTLRVLLVLLHDFPEFLCDYHYSFCDVIPRTCIQLRNLILSAFPRNMRLPDPFMPNLKVDLLPEISQPPRMMSNPADVLVGAGLKDSVDEFLTSRGPSPTFLPELHKKLLMSSGGRIVYSTPLINALVLYVGQQAIQQLNEPATSTVSPVAPREIFQQLAKDLPAEGRYLFLNAITNQLRFPNNHTHYFSCVLLCLFADATDEAVQEQVTRVLLERLIAHRPHPWGLLITFIELIKNPRYDFWSHEFTRCAPEIERLFESVARRCMAPGMSGGGQASDMMNDGSMSSA